MEILKKAYTVIDVETTGLNPLTGDKITEIAAIKIINGKIQTENSFVTLINPEREISSEASQISQITNAMVKDAPKMREIVENFTKFIEHSIIIGHNIEFDIGFIRMELEQCGINSGDPRHVCTMQLSQKIFPYQQRHNLDIVMQRMKVTSKGERHRALTDVIATAEVFLKFCEHRPDIVEEQLAQKQHTPVMTR